MSVNYTTYINVPYAQKDDAKKLGAKWSSYYKSWYVPANTDRTPFLSLWTALYQGRRQPVVPKAPRRQELSQIISPVQAPCIIQPLLSDESDDEDECPGCETGCDADAPHRARDGAYHPACCTRAAESHRVADFNGGRFSGTKESPVMSILRNINSRIGNPTNKGCCLGSGCEKRLTAEDKDHAFCNSCWDKSFPPTELRKKDFITPSPVPPTKETTAPTPAPTCSGMSPHPTPAPAPRDTQDAWESHRSRACYKAEERELEARCELASLGY